MNTPLPPTDLDRRSPSLTLAGGTPVLPRQAVLRLLAGGCVALSLALGACSSSGNNGSLATTQAPAAEEGSSRTVAAAAAVEPEATRFTAYINGEPQAAPEIPMGSPETIARILDEGLHRNRVMEHLSHLCEEIGPRLTGSSNVDAANHWAAEQFRAWGLTKVEMKEWGTVAMRFDRGPSTGKFIGMIERPGRDGDRRMEERVLREPQFTTLAWGAGTDGPVRGPVVRMPTTDEEFAEIIEKHPGAWILVPPPPITGAQGARGMGSLYNRRFQHRQEVRQKVAAGEVDASTLEVEDRLLFADIAGFIVTSRDERVWTTSAPGWREMTEEKIPQDVEVTVRLSDYDYLNSRLADGETVYAEFDLPHTFTPGPIPCYNTVAEIRGTEKPDEVIIISAHLDSWNGPGSQGTTDNGTGSAVTLEAARILMASGAQPKRTIRFILWTGEEQGLLGSAAYVRQIQDELPRVSAMFVDDGGTNYQGGLACTHDMAPMLAAATAPVNDLFFDSADGKPLRVNIRPADTFRQSGGSDHMSFVRVGVPGFFWDEVGRAEYGYGWHTQHDRMDLAIPEYLKQSATCSAITAYNLACAPDLLPRWQASEENNEPRQRPDPSQRRGRQQGGGGERPTQ